MHVLFLRPTYDVYHRFHLGKRESKLPPLAFMYLSAYLERGGHKATILDPEAKNIVSDEWIENVVEAKPDMVGLSATTPEIINIARAAIEIKSRLPSVKIVVGGAHATVLPEETLDKNSCFDYLVIGEGEETLLELVNTLQNGTPVDNIQGLAYRKDGKAIANPRRPPIMELDNIPLPARHLIDAKDYMLPVPEKGIVLATMMQTSRGCPYRCVFCYRSLDPSPLRARSPKSVVDELEKCEREYGIEAVIFCDDTFTFPKKRVLEICDLIIERGLSIKWYCLARADTLDREVVEKMKDAGCMEISIGVETGNQKQLDAIGKKTTLGHYRRAFKIIDDVGGIETRGSFILGLPYDTRKTMQETIDFALELDLHAAFFNIATPYPGSELEVMAREGRGICALSKNWEDYQRWGGAVVEVGDVGPEELLAWQKRAMISFYTRPRIILHHMKYLVQAGHFPLGYVPNPIGFIISAIKSLRTLRDDGE